MAPSTDTTESVTFTGSNARDVRAFIDAHPLHPAGVAWWITRTMSASTELQAWHYVTRSRPAWPKAATAAIWSPRLEAWIPVRPGDRIVRTPDGHAVDPAKGD